jgi:ABC-type transport system involved in cytochrome bd biosynthesis fused ATPase/permease subunit
MSYKKQKTSHLQLKQQAPHRQQQEQQHQQQQQQQQHQEQQQQHQAAQGFKSLGLQLHPDSSLITYVYIKRQKAQDGDAASTAHALYVTGLPLGVDEAALQAIFQLFGDVEDVVMHASKVCPCYCCTMTP